MIKEEFSSKEYHQQATRRIQQDIKRRSKCRKYNKKRRWQSYIIGEVKRVTAKINHIDCEIIRFRHLEKHFKKANDD